MLLGSPSLFLLFCASAKAGIQASFDCPTTLIHHNSYWLCMHVLLAFLVCAKTVMMCISVMSLLFAHCVCVCVLTGVPVPTAQALCLSNQMQPAGTAAWHRHWQLDTLWTSSAAVVMLSVLHAQQTHTSLPLVNRYRLQPLVGATSAGCHNTRASAFHSRFVGKHIFEKTFEAFIQLLHLPHHLCL